MMFKYSIFKNIDLSRFPVLLLLQLLLCFQSSLRLKEFLHQIKIHSLLSDECIDITILHFTFFDCAYLYPHQFLNEFKILKLFWRRRARTCILHSKMDVLLRVVVVKELNFMIIGLGWLVVSPINLVVNGVFLSLFLELVSDKAVTIKHFPFANLTLASN